MYAFPYGKKDFQEKWRLNEEPFQNLWGPQVMIFIKMLKGHKEAYIYNITHIVTKAHYGTTVIYTISHEMHVQQDAGG